MRTGSLHLLTGAWGAGKSSVVPHLARLLPECVVFDWDGIIPGLSQASGKDVYTDPSSWKGLRETWEAVLLAVLQGGHDVVLCGPATPPDFAPFNSLSRWTIRCAYLNCPDSVLVERLRARGESDAAIAEELSAASALRNADYDVISVENARPLAVAERVAAWVRQVPANG